MSATARRTRFSDVCGSIDELKRLLHEAPEACAAHPEEPDALVEDALFMLARMELRLREYEGFRERVAAIAAQLQAITGSRRQEALALAPPLRRQLRAGRPLTDAERAATVGSAEAIRRVAQDLEDNLGRYKTLALELARAYRDVRGGRPWVLDEEDAQAQDTPPGEPAWSRWLPPSPHRERIVRYLRAGRAHLLPPDRAATPEGPPLVQFEDGGVMPLPDVRWAEAVRNFYPAGAPPHPDGRRYRGA
jgi:hypothetical protein